MNNLLRKGCSTFTLFRNLSSSQPLHDAVKTNLHDAVKTNVSTQLKGMLNSPKLEFLMEAHSGISAKIAEETGE